MLYSCTHVATVSVKRLIVSQVFYRAMLHRALYCHGKSSVRLWRWL